METFEGFFNEFRSSYSKEDLETLNTYIGLRDAIVFQYPEAWKKFFISKETITIFKATISLCSDEAFVQSFFPSVKEYLKDFEEFYPYSNLNQILSSIVANSYHRVVEVEKINQREEQVAAIIGRRSYGSLDEFEIEHYAKQKVRKKALKFLCVNETQTRNRIIKNAYFKALGNCLSSDSLEKHYIKMIIDDKNYIYSRYPIYDGDVDLMKDVFDNYLGRIRNQK